MPTKANNHFFIQMIEIRCRDKQNNTIMLFAILVLIMLCHTSLSIAKHEDRLYEDKRKIPSPILASMTWSQDKGFNLLEDVTSKTPDTVGWVNFTNAINQTGWSYLDIKTNANFPDKIQVRFE